MQLDALLSAELKKNLMDLYKQYPIQVKGQQEPEGADAPGLTTQQEAPATAARDSHNSRKRPAVAAVDAGAPAAAAPPSKRLKSSSGQLPAASAANNSGSGKPQQAKRNAGSSRSTVQKGAAHAIKSANEGEAAAGKQGSAAAIAATAAPGRSKTVPAVAAPISKSIKRPLLGKKTQLARTGSIGSSTSSADTVDISRAADTAAVAVNSGAVAAAACSPSGMQPGVKDEEVAVTAEGLQLVQPSEAPLVPTISHLSQAQAGPASCQDRIQAQLGVQAEPESRQDASQAQVSLQAGPDSRQDHCQEVGVLTRHVGSCATPGGRFAAHHAATMTRSSSHAMRHLPPNSKTTVGSRGTTHIVSLGTGNSTVTLLPPRRQQQQLLVEEPEALGRSRGVLQMLPQLECAEHLVADQMEEDRLQQQRRQRQWLQWQLTSMPLAAMVQLRQKPDQVLDIEREEHPSAGSSPDRLSSGECVSSITFAPEYRQSLVAAAVAAAPAMHVLDCNAAAEAVAAAAAREAQHAAAAAATAAAEAASASRAAVQAEALQAAVRAAAVMDAPDAAAAALCYAPELPPVDARLGALVWQPWQQQFGGESMPACSGMLAYNGSQLGLGGLAGGLGPMNQPCSSSYSSWAQFAAQLGMTPGMTGTAAAGLGFSAQRPYSCYVQPNFGFNEAGEVAMYGLGGSDFNTLLPCHGACATAHPSDVPGVAAGTAAANGKTSAVADMGTLGAGVHIKNELRRQDYPTGCGKPEGGSGTISAAAGIFAPASAAAAPAAAGTVVDTSIDAAAAADNAADSGISCMSGSAPDLLCDFDEAGDPVMFSYPSYGLGQAEGSGMGAVLLDGVQLFRV